MIKKIYVIIILSLIPVIGWTQGKIEPPNNDKNLEFEILDREKRTVVLISGIGSTDAFVTIPSSANINGTSYSVIEIGSWAFSYCNELTTVTIPNSVMEIGDGAFAECKELKEIIVGLDNKYFSSSSGVLFNKHKTKLLQFPAGLKGNYIIPNSVKEIVGGAFKGCSGLTSVNIPNSVTEIGWETFAFCSGLTSVTIPNSVTVIGEGAFRGCRGLTSVTIPNSVTEIGEGTFAFCSVLTSVIIPNSVKEIGALAFYQCSGLTSVTIPNSVTKIGIGALSNCSKLIEIIVDSNNKYFSSSAGVLFNKQKTKVLQCPGGYKGNYTIPNSVTEIGEAAFYQCEGLTSVTIPNSVKEIGDWAFYDCSWLTSVKIPNSVTEIGKEVFHGCYALKDVYLPRHLRKQIEKNGVFRDCPNVNLIYK